MKMDSTLLRTHNTYISKLAVDWQKKRRLTREDGETDRREDRTKQKMEYTLLLMIVVLMMTKCKTLRTHMREFNLLFLSYPECFSSTQVFLGFPVSVSKCCDGSQDSKLPLHASNIGLPT